MVSRVALEKQAASEKQAALEKQVVRDLVSAIERLTCPARWIGIRPGKRWTNALIRTAAARGRFSGSPFLPDVPGGVNNGAESPMSNATDATGHKTS